MLKPTRILICGGRDYNNEDAFYEVMSMLTPHFAEKFCIIQGGAKGADYLALSYAEENGIPCITVKANWNYFGKKAGMLRNEWMITYCMPELVVAFEGGVGTKGMVHLAKHFNIPVYEVK